MEDLFYWLAIVGGTSGLVALLTYWIAYILKKNSPYKNSEWVYEPNKRVLEKHKADILRYDILLRINQNAINNSENELQKAPLIQHFRNLELQKEKFLKSIGYLPENKE
jgi:hypothetical protein